MNKKEICDSKFHHFILENFLTTHHLTIFFLSREFQLWDIRDGMCKQTFPGHESDINAVTVKPKQTSPFSFSKNAKNRHYRAQSVREDNL